jgi:hypothetical protein
VPCTLKLSLSSLRPALAGIWKPRNRSVRVAAVRALVLALAMVFLVAGTMAGLMAVLVWSGPAQAQILTTETSQTVPAPKVETPTGKLLIVQITPSHQPEGWNLSYALQLGLGAEVADALHKGTPLVFVAEARILQKRWYWWDKPLAVAQRTWRLTYHPLTRTYRVHFGSLSQSYEQLSVALAAIRRTTDWQVSDTSLEGHGLYLEFSFRLDPSQLPRPLQIGTLGQSSWMLEAQQTLPLPVAP